jgi:hypothetical protein
METYFQFDGASCMDCHQISNAQGRDFVMFVTIDAFRPGVPAPGALFSTKLSGDLGIDAGRSLDNDPVVKSLIEFFESKKDQ